jgi:hypothetical protein
MTRTVSGLVVLAALAALPSAQTSRRTLDIYVVDVEGGNATLFVAPSGESLPIDTGNGGAAAVRDAGRDRRSVSRLASRSVSNSAALVHALAPRAAVMNNGTRKGGQPDSMTVLHSSPGLQDLWQIHFSELSGQEYTTPGVFIANTIDRTACCDADRAVRAGGPPVHNGTAYWNKVQARQDGSFTITNARNGFSKTYAATGR